MDKLDRFSIIKGDIVRMNTQAIVNAANTSLLGGGGVDGSIHRAAGPQLLAECETLGGCETGKAKMTGGYKLKADYVIHTPGPIWRGGRAGEDKLLASCYRSCLELAVENDIKSVSFPSISTGVYHFPVDKAAEICINEIMSFLGENQSLEEVRMVCYSDADYKVYLSALKGYQKKKARE